MGCHCQCSGHCTGHIWSRLPTPENFRMPMTNLGECDERTLLLSNTSKAKFILPYISGRFCHSNLLVVVFPRNGTTILRG